jgi:type I restriction enzyme S subunit
VGLGKVCLIRHDTAINQDLRGIVPKDSKKLSVRYLFYWLKSIAHLIEKEGTGATVQGVKLPFIKSLQIPIPPLAEQRTIVARLEALSAETKRLEEIYAAKVQSLEELKRSVLGKAFAGEL